MVEMIKIMILTAVEGMIFFTLTLLVVVVVVVLALLLALVIIGALRGEI